MKLKKYFYVTTNADRVFENLTEAKAYAEKLAAATPGKEFSVLATVGLAKVPTIQSPVWLQVEEE